MSGGRLPTVMDAFATLTGTDAARPLITFYDDATGERTELSGATLANWVAKTANLLVDGAGLEAGEIAALRLPPHWQTAAVLLGCWWAGLRVDLDQPGVPAGPPAAVAFVAGDPDAIRAGEVYALALAPLAAPFRPAPPSGTLDYVIEVRPHGDHFTPAVPPRADSPALADGTTHAALVARARELPPGVRLLVDAQAGPDPVDWLVAPLLAGGSVVLCAHLDHARVADRLTAERATLLG